MNEREFVIQRINEINEWRRETVLHSETLEQRKQIDARVLELREKQEKKTRRRHGEKAPCCQHIGVLSGITGSIRQGHLLVQKGHGFTPGV